MVLATLLFLALLSAGIGTLVALRRSPRRWWIVWPGLTLAGLGAGAVWLAAVFVLMALADSGNPGLWLMLLPVIIPAGVAGGVAWLARGVSGSPPDSSG